MRLIDADAVVTIQTYDDMYEEWGSKTMTVAEAMDEFSDEGCPPTIDAKPARHGKWLNGDMPTYGGYKCSVCRRRTVHYKANYCPHCGAKMDGGKQDTD